MEKERVYRYEEEIFEGWDIEVNGKKGDGVHRNIKGIERRGEYIEGK